MQISLKEYMEKAKSKEEGGDLKGAVEIYQEMIRAKPSDASIHNNLGTLKAKEGDYAAAFAAFKAAVELDPNNLSARFNLARIYNLQKNYLASELHFRKAIDLAPDDQEIRKDFLWMLKPGSREFFTVCYVLENQTNYFGAERIYRKAVTTIPEDPACWFMLGIVHFIKKEYDAAEAAFEEAIERDKSFGLAYNFLANTYAAVERREEGIKLAHFVVNNFMTPKC